MVGSRYTTVAVPHLNGTIASCRISEPYDPNKPTLILVNSLLTTTDLYNAQFNDKRLNDAMNLIAIEPLGHGKTRTASPAFTYWDTAIMNLQVLKALDIKPPMFALGTSQGGWIVTRMALLQPETVAGLVVLGTSMDHNSDRSFKLGCLDTLETLAQHLKTLDASSHNSDFIISDDLRVLAIESGFGADGDKATVQFWHQEMIKNYLGNDGRLRLRQAIINLRDRDGLHNRITDVTCPVLWMHGTTDPIYSIANAKEELSLFTSTDSKELVIIEGGQHYLSASHPAEVDSKVLEFVRQGTGRFACHKQI